MEELSVAQLSPEDQAAFSKTTNCYACGQSFRKMWGKAQESNTRKKVLDRRDSGKYRGAACEGRNLATRRADRMVAWFHSFEGYDSTPILRACARLKEQKEHEKIRFEVIPRNMERVLTGMVTFARSPGRDSRPPQTKQTAFFGFCEKQ